MSRTVLPTIEAVYDESCDKRYMTEKEARVGRNYVLFGCWESGGKCIVEWNRLLLSGGSEVGW